MTFTLNLKSFALGVTIALGTLGVYALAVNLPNTFASGDVISAAKMNANFTAFKTAVDALETKSASLKTAVDTLEAKSASQVAARAWALVSPTGTVSASGPSGVTWTITRQSVGHYCIATTPSLLGNYDPLLATLHGYQDGRIAVNTEYGDACNPVSNGHSVSTWDSAGAPADRYFMIALF